MAASQEVREFLTTRRARVTPADVGLATSGRRRVPGLRRDEVAMLAGISVKYYTQLERGNARGASDDDLRAEERHRLVAGTWVHDVGIDAPLLSTWNLTWIADDGVRSKAIGRLRALAGD